MQQDIVSSEAKYKVIACGRRFGKTLMAARTSVDKFLEGQHILLTSASQSQADVFWSYVRKWTGSLPGLYKNEGRRILRYGEGEIRVKTGSNPDTLKSEWYHLIVIDEAAYLDPRVWFEACLPMLADKNGDAYFLSTPNRRNWFWELYAMAASGNDSDWQAWNAPTHANPYMPPEAIAKMAENMSEDTYNQEIMAQFLAGSGQVFRRIDECAVLERGASPIEGHKYVIGGDWGQIKDSTVFIVMDATAKQQVDMDRFNQIDWSLQRARLETLYYKWQPVVIVAEKNSIGSPNIEALQKNGLPVQAFETTASSKPPLIESLVLAFERDEIRTFNDPILKNELMAYERKVSPITGRSQYSAPPGLHDDCVMALALAWSACSQGVSADEMHRWERDIISESNISPALASALRNSGIDLSQRKIK